MSGMPGGGQMDPAMMQQMMSNPMVQQVCTVDRMDAKEGGANGRARGSAGSDGCRVVWTWMRRLPVSLGFALEASHRKQAENQLVLEPLSLSVLEVFHPEFCVSVPV